MCVFVCVGGSFDIADRTFRKLETTWWLSSSESATDVKELVPEFFFLPEFLANSERTYIQTSAASVLKLKSMQEKATCLLQEYFDLPV